MVPQPLGRTALRVTPIGYGAFKIGRNEGIKYPQGYALPSDGDVERLLNGVLDLGVNLIDTAPAYGTSEERIGRAIGHRRREYVLSTKVGENFEGGRSTYDFSAAAVRASVERSLRRLRTDVLDVAYIHSDGRDVWIMRQTDVVETLADLKAAGKIRAIGMSGKTVEGARAAMEWADVLAVTLHEEDRSHEAVVSEAAKKGVGVVVKKGLASGHLDAGKAIGYVLGQSGVSSLLVGSLSLEHMAANVRAAEGVRGTAS